MSETLVDMFFKNAARLGDKTALVSKEDGVFKEISYRKCAETVTHFAYGMSALGVNRNEHVAILSENRPEWAFADLAILSLGGVTIPIYPTLTDHLIKYILNDSGSTFIVLSQPEFLESIRSIFNDLKTLKQIITIFDQGEKEFTHMHTFDEVIGLGKRHQQENPDFLERRRAELDGRDMVSVLYTSGTTDNPKGVMLTNDNFLSNIEMALKVIKVYQDDVFLSFLPLCHVFERMAGYYLPLYVGGTIAYAESIQAVGDNMREVRPTVMTSVPRLYEKMYGLIQDTIARGSFARKMIFKWCVYAGKKHFTQKRKRRISPLASAQFRIAGKLVFGKLRERTGGRIRFFVSGGAPLEPEIGRFFACAGLPILEGYGLTETSPVIAANPLEDYRFGTVGIPLPGLGVKIADDGEILTRGPHVMKGYFNDPEGTRKVIDKEGWFYTGDIGVLDKDGYLTITDRKKNIIVTSGGKNIAPQQIENMMLRSRYIDQIVMIGDRRRFPAALIVPAYDNVADYFSMQNITFDSRAAMVNDKRTCQLIESEIKRLSMNLSSFETIKKFILLDREFTQGNGELTPTLKVKRNLVEKKFASEIDRLYEE